jgi:HEAT repeat protein
MLFGVSAFLSRWSIEPDHEAILNLQLLGEQRASNEQDIRFMLDHLENGTMEARASAAWALGRSGRGDVLPQLLEVARDDSDVSVRINAIVAVAELGGKEIQADLVGFLEDRDLEIQRAALRGLADKRFAGAAETIGQFMLDNEPLRGMAADVLGNMGNVAALPVLRQTASDPQEDVRSRVAHALGKLGDRRAVPTLIEMLDDQRWAVRANAAQSLGMIGDPVARPSLEEARNDPNTQVRAAAEAALQKLP